jgi:ADP-dependent NAD(P)H-hydrate dehydratase / NAD(P)H-hydrate epimerase
MATACADRAGSGLYSVAQIRAIEQAALATLPAGTLMRRAGAAVARAALGLLLPSAATARILVAAGPGNNGGDALEAAALLAGDGHQVSIVMPVMPDMPTVPADARSDAQQALAKAQQSTARFIPYESLAQEEGWDLVIDGLFGIGLGRALDGACASLVAYMNAQSCPRLAIDVPSGLDADHGTIVGDTGTADIVCTAIRASTTISFIADKPGLHTAHGRDHSGEILIDSLEIDASLYPAPLARLNRPQKFSHCAAPRAHASHKGSYGDLTIIGGASGMGGAVLLAARMGAMAGAGRVYAGFIDAAPAFDPLHPELMCRNATTLPLSSGAVVAGPGLGQSREACDALARVLASELPAVIDADALNLIAAEPALQQKTRQRRAPTLLTPHPLEAARLLGTSAAHIQSDRLGAARELAAFFLSTVILKGSGSVIANPQAHLVINTTGNPALATAGTGDVLSGLCGALLAQHWPLQEAALAAVWLHGAAADKMVAEGIGPRGITAGELLPAIRSLLNQLARPNQP